ncbi:MAG: hypothetical protein KC481_20740 [Acidimicrobiaceae bacterium]|nr:hypothetical protein [Acidimicrobiaceae bacterium]
MEPASRTEPADRDLLQLLHETFGGNPWIIAGSIAQGISGRAIALRPMGASDITAIASRLGVSKRSDDDPMKRCLLASQ